LEPNLHDGSLIGIRIPEGGTIELSVSDTLSNRYCITFEGVVEFFATDFRAGNIILDVSLFHGAEVGLGQLATLRDVDTDIARSAAEMQRILDKVHAESLWVVELTSSYGCQLIGVASRVAVFRV
jgi:hypothetical protein